MEEIRSSKIFFTTAYMWDTAHQIEAIEKALREARGAGCRLALDLADPFSVDRSRQALLSHLIAGLDLVFANREEARIMTGLEPDAACREMAKKATVSVVKDGANGAWVAHGPDLIHVEAHPVKVVDTTGAGDVFAAGFLAGLVGGQSLGVCAELATVLAADLPNRRVAPRILRVRAELAHARGDVSMHEELLRDAAARYREAGEIWMADRLEHQLDSPTA